MPDQVTPATLPIYITALPIYITLNYPTLTIGPTFGGEIGTLG